MAWAIIAAVYINRPAVIMMVSWSVINCGGFFIYYWCRCINWWGWCIIHRCTYI
jgi:hypothetical protein